MHHPEPPILVGPGALRPMSQSTVAIMATGAHGPVLTLHRAHRLPRCALASTDSRKLFIGICDVDGFGLAHKCVENGFTLVIDD